MRALRVAWLAATLGAGATAACVDRATSPGTCPSFSGKLGGAVGAGGAASVSAAGGGDGGAASSVAAGTSWAAAGRTIAAAAISADAVSRAA